MDFDLGARNADVLIKFEALFQPVIGEGQSVLGAAEVFDFHLLELARAEDVITRVDFVAESFADLGDAEGEFFARGFEDVLELHEHSLRRFGAEVDEVFVGFQRSGIALEHEVESARFGQIASPAGRAIRNAVLLRKLVCAVAGLAGFAVDHGIAESFLVPARLPHSAIHDDGAVHSDHVFAFVDDAAPPEILEVAFQFDPHRAVVPEAVETAVDFGGLENKAAAFAEADDFFHPLLGFFGHKKQSVAA